MALSAVVLSALSLASPRGAPAWLVVACAARTVLVDGGGAPALALALAAALVFRAALLVSTLAHEVRATRAPHTPSRRARRRQLTWRAPRG